MKHSNKYATELRKPFVLRNILGTFLKAFFFLVILCSIVAVFAIGIFYHTFVYRFKQFAQVTDTQMITLFKEGVKTPIQQTDHHKNILVLGTDELDNRTGDPVLTDTMMLLSMNTKSGNIKTISLPRDLWIDEYKTKINALYQYGEQRYPNTPEQFPTTVIQDLTQIDIHHTFVLSLHQLRELIDTLGGVSIEIPESFTDDKFPRTDVDIRTEQNPEKLYEKIEFVKGTEVMSGERALKFVRSRHSSSDQGTDDARTIRQQLVMNSILLKLKDSALLSNPEVLGKLFVWYKTHFNSSLPVGELIHVTTDIGVKIFEISIEPQTLSFQTAEHPGVIFHPPVSKYGQWVYEVTNIELFQTELKEKLGLN